MNGRTYRVTASQAAEQDVLDIYDYLKEQGGDEPALQMLNGYSEAVESLEQWPDRGSRPPELPTIPIGTIRQLLLRPYRLIYRVHADEVRILMFTDGRRNVPALMEERMTRPDFN